MLNNQLKHNKKRNIGLLNEFFARQIASCILEKNYGGVDIAKTVWTKYISEGSEIMQEQKIFDIIYTTKIQDLSVARSLLEDLKRVAIKQDTKKLNDEKTRLLHEINNAIKDSKFFDRAVTDYRMQATIQTMMNCWRESAHGNVEAIQASALLEDQVLRHMTTSSPIQEQKDASVLEYGDEEIQGLVLNIMLEKFNKSYGESLTEEQKKILNMYVFSSSDVGKKQSLLEMLNALREEAVVLLQRECITNHNRLLVEKFSKIRNLLSESSSPYRIVTEGALSDDLITFYMTVSKIKEELGEKQDEASR